MCSCCNGKVTGLAHIGVFVKDIEKSIAFYTDVLGFECYHRNQISTDEGLIKCGFMKCGTCDLELVEFPVTPEKKDGPVDHIALAVDDIDAAQARLLEMGIKFETEVPVDLTTFMEHGVRYINFRGPDGEHLELNQVL